MCGCQSEHALSQWPSQANLRIKTKIVCGCRNARQSLSGVDVCWSRFWSRNRFYFVSVSSRACVDKMVEPKSRDRSSSTESQRKFPGGTHYRRRNDNHYRCQQCRLNEGLTLCTEDSPCEICKDWLPEAWQAQEKANEQKHRCKAAAAAKAAKKSQERDTMDDSVEIHTQEEVIQLNPTKRKSDGSSKTKRAKTATGSGSKATGVEQSAGRPSRSREPKKSVASSVSMVERPRSDSSSGAKGSEYHRSRSGERNRRSQRSDRRQDSPRSHHSSRHDSGCWEGERARPTSSGGSSSRRQADSMGGPGSSRVFSRATDVRPSGSSSHSHHHHRKSSGDRRSLSSSSLRESADHKSPPGHHQDGRRESAERSGSSFISRREVQLSPAIAQSPERRTITVIASPARQNTLKNLQLKWTTQQEWRVRQRLWTAQQVTAQQVTARQMTTRQVRAQQMTAQHMMGQQVTGQQADPSWSWMKSRTLWMSQRKLPTQQVNSQQETAQHLMMTTRQVWPAQHTIRTRQWTARQLWMVRWPMVLQQGTRQLQDRTHPRCRMSAVFCSRHCQERSTRLLWLISCPCGLWCSVGWTQLWLLFMPRPGQLHSQPFLRPEMMTPHPGGPILHLGSHTDDPGCQWDGPGHLWERPEDWMTLESPHVPIRPSEGLHRLIHLPEMLLMWIFRWPWHHFWIWATMKS